MPGYKETVRPFSSDAMNIVYVEYDMPGPSRMPFSAAPDKNGYLWIPNFGVANKITRLDPKTGEMQDFPVPNVGTAAVHSAVPAADGSVWLAEQGSNKVGRWDPATQKITEYQDLYLARKEGIDDGGIEAHGPTRSQRKCVGQRQPADEIRSGNRKVYAFRRSDGYAYDVKPDKNGDVWFTSPGAQQDRQSGRENDESHRSGLRRRRNLFRGAWKSITTASFGSANLTAERWARFDPKTQTFKEYPVARPRPHSYAHGFRCGRLHLVRLT